MEKSGWFTAEEIDFLNEMMNVGAGNAASALEQILNYPIDLILPAVHIVPPADFFKIVGSPYKLITCAKMGMVGDIKGSIFFIMDSTDRDKLITLAENASELIANMQDKKLSVIEELSNILAGVYLTSIHDFCSLNIYHTVPLLVIDMLQSVLDESIAAAAAEVDNLFFIENDFVITNVPDGKIKVGLILIPSPKSVADLAGSLKEAKRKLGLASQ